MLLFRMLMKYINNLLLNKQLFWGVLYQRLAVLRNSFFKYKLHVTKKILLMTAVFLFDKLTQP